MTDVAVLILHPTPAGRSTQLEQWVAASRAALAERHRSGFLAVGASEAVVVAGPPDDRTFGERIAGFLASRPPAGLVVLGSGAIPLATVADRRAFVDAAASNGRVALANNRYSADIVAIAGASGLSGLEEVATDNALPRWLAETAGYEVRDLRERWRLGVDVDGPLDLALLGPRRWLPSAPARSLGAVRERLTAVARTASDPSAELVVAGRTSPAALAWLERTRPARVRALVEERGMRTARPGQRPARSSLGLVLDRDGPDALGSRLAELGDAAIVDTRVLIAHRFGPDERGWPAARDRFASDLLLPDEIADPWLTALTASARDAPIPIVLGGHTLVGPGLRLVFGRTSAWT